MLCVLDWVKEYGGIAKAKSKLHSSNLRDFNRSLKDLDAILVNPVTIPRRWEIEHIPNPLQAYNANVYEQVLGSKEILFREHLKKYPFHNCFGE